MSEKRYPTRMHEVLGVEPEERFTHSDYGDRKFWLSESGLLYRICNDGTSIPTKQGTLVRFINNPERLTRRPRLTEEQVAQLKALVTLGYRWLIKDSTDAVFAYTKMPAKQSEWWNCGGANVRIFIDLPPGILTSLVSWSDPAPLDIVQTLRDAGVDE